MIKTKEKYEIISQISSLYPVNLLCEIAQVSRSGYYKWISRKATPNKDCKIEEKILDVYTKSRKIYGYRRIKVALKRIYGIVVNHKKVKRLMKKLGIKSVIRRKKFKYINPKNLDQGKVEPNLLNRNFKASKLNEKWVTDITYLYYGPTRKKMYLSALKDLYNNEIISYKLSTSLDITFVEETIYEAFEKSKKCDLSNLIIHSDQGCHYKSHSYKNILQENNITQSMSRKGNCYDNACIENFFGHLKSELIHQTYFHTKADLINAINDYICWYNNERFQEKLNNHTPVEFRCVV